MNRCFLMVARIWCSQWLELRGSMPSKNETHKQVRSLLPCTTKGAVIT